MIDPLLRKCHCGYVWHFRKIDYVKMLIFEEYTFVCPQCRRKHRYKLVFHAIEEYDETRKWNNELESRKELNYRNP